VSAALLATGAVFLAFLAKLSGPTLLAAALVAGSLVCFAFGRRITQGMIGGALGAVAAITALYVAFLARGPTIVSETSWSLPYYSNCFRFPRPLGCRSVMGGPDWIDILPPPEHRFIA
jgi:hypothetical protein